MEYDRYGCKETMEAIKGEWVFPPILPGISPESDWLRFERWIHGEPVMQKLAVIISDITDTFRAPDDIPDTEIEAESKRLVWAIEESGIHVGLKEELPPRLLFVYLYETLNDDFYVGDGGWNIDGCTGYCPGCIQRPWCDAGQRLCWGEDEEAGKMHLTEELAPYVSASPQSLALLRQTQAEEDAAWSKFKEENPDPLFEEKSQPDEDWLAKQN